MDSNGLPRWNVYDANCPTRLVLDRVADKWTVLIVGRLALGTRRFGELSRDVSGISPKVLTQKLRELERDGILTRRVYASVPPKVEYDLTPLGKTLIELVQFVQSWAENNIDEILQSQQAYDQRSVEPSSAN
ncbi:MAG: transcriptional regulator [Chloroflexi bacterium]|nr:MAG: transcriptional regulator [Chloroflexota bacterium]